MVRKVTKKPKKFTTSIYIIEELWKDFELLTKEKGDHISTLIEEWVSKYCKENKKLLQKLKIKNDVIRLVNESDSEAEMLEKLLKAIKVGGDDAWKIVTEEIQQNRQLDAVLKTPEGKIFLEIKKEAVRFKP